MAKAKAGTREKSSAELLVGEAFVKLDEAKSALENAMSKMADDDRGAFDHISDAQDYAERGAEEARAALRALEGA